MATEVVKLENSYGPSEAYAKVVREEQAARDAHALTREARLAIMVDYLGWEMRRAARVLPRNKERAREILSSAIERANVRLRELGLPEVLEPEPLIDGFCRRCGSDQGPITGPHVSYSECCAAPIVTWWDRSEWLNNEAKEV